MESVYVVNTYNCEQLKLHENCGRVVSVANSLFVSCPRGINYL